MLIDSPFIVINNATVLPGVTLTIEPSVEVRFGENFSLNVKGTLIADGKYAKGVKVEIWNVNGEKVASGITDNSGEFIKQLLEGNYTVGTSIYLL